MISVTVTFGNIAAATSQKYVKVIVFPVVSGQNEYTEDDVSDLSKIVGKDIGTEIFKIEYQGSDLLSGDALASWNDTTFEISDSVTVTTGKIIIWYY